PAETSKEDAPKEEPSQPSELKVKFTVKGEDGSDVEVEENVEGLKRGYMMEKDYRSKTAQLARAREESEAKIRSAIDPKLKEYDEKLQLAEQVIWHTLAPDIQNTDWNTLAKENPAEWAQKMQAANNVNAKLTAIQAERAKISQEQAKQQTENLKKVIQESNQTLADPIKGIPGWNQELYGKVLQYGQEAGLKAEEVNTITDPRAIKLLWKAKQYDDLQKAKPAVEKRVVTVPKVTKPGAMPEASDPSADKWNKGLARLRKSNSTEDAVSLAKVMFEREGVK
ncbi:MAG TPA: hypothetical protein VE177_06645, partial [Candidatus Binatus sp.]|nr:hypothetical protein [Candidatus Binatus sp.]